MSFNNGPTIVTNGLVLALDAGDKNSYPGSGTTWSDLAGSNNGTLINGPTFDSGNGGSIVFDGVDDKVTTTIPYYTTATINLWVYPIAGFGLFQYGDSTGTPLCLLDYTNTDLRVYVIDYYINYPSVLTLNQWNNICLTLNYSSLQYTLYINSVLQGNGSIQSSVVQNGLIILGDHNFRTNGNCKIAATQIYNRVLSASEVLQNYNATKARFGL